MEGSRWGVSGQEASTRRVASRFTLYRARTWLRDEGDELAVRREGLSGSLRRSDVSFSLSQGNKPPEAFFYRPREGAFCVHHIGHYRAVLSINLYIVYL